MTTHSDQPAPVPPLGPEPGAPTVGQQLLGGMPAGVAQGLGNLLMAAVMGASSMGDHPACPRRWSGIAEQDTATEACGAVLLESTDAVGGRHVHYCDTDVSAHELDIHHVCVCGTDWTERTDGVAEVVGPNETIVRPAEEQP